MDKLSRQSARLFALLLAYCSVTVSQTTFGTLGGTITDPSGALIVGAQVTLTNLGTTAKLVAVSNDVGLYQFVNLPPGNYRIDVEMSGFQHFTRQPLVVQVQQSYRIDVAMVLGASTQTIEVGAATPLIQSQTSSLGQVIAGTAVSEMPLNGRNSLNLITLVPSVIPQGGALGTPIGQNGTAWGKLPGRRGVRRAERHIPGRSAFE